jgi:hypothetical protein
MPKQARRAAAKTMKSFKIAIGQVTQRYGKRQVFSDFLQMVVCTLSLGAKEDRYLEVISRYDPKEINLFPEAMASLICEMDNDGMGLLDVLGTYFELEISLGHNGQFFTPQPICELIACMNPISFGQTVADPACGSGRMLLSAAKVNRNALFFGADVDADCARMTAINLCLNGLFGEVAWMDTLRNEYFSGWKITLHPDHLVPYLLEIPSEKSRLHLKLPDTEPPSIQQPQLIIDF